ncbi:signal peptidase I [Williamsia sp. CHRR-6]|uniref:signal peptidase I n=1 Tax=Williamsia sp. CHRR-6 TaxID=2835871 RepID=UPI001BDA7899|nr:signal peptidase I [Williamsia sp. CHRR-6]MBT0568285.1 signal peptidase I [Williamsia sp. CHRR-6]
MSDRRRRADRVGVATDPEATAVLPRIRDEGEVDPAHLLRDRVRTPASPRVTSQRSGSHTWAISPLHADTATPDSLDPTAPEPLLPASADPARDRRRWRRFAFDATVVVVIVAVFGVLLVGVVIPRVAGATPYTITTGSMTGTYDPGSLVVVRPTATSKLRPGQVVTYQLRSGRAAVVTHRIVSTYADGAGRLRFITKGDANPTPDPDPVLPEQIRGVVWYSVPYLGRVNAMLTGTVRTVVIGLVVATLFTYAGAMIISGVRDDRRAKASAAAVSRP